MVLGSVPEETVCGELQDAAAGDIQAIVAALRAGMQATRAAQEGFASQIKDLRMELGSTREQQASQKSQAERLLCDMCKELGSLHEAIRRQAELAGGGGLGSDVHAELRELRSFVHRLTGELAQNVEELTEASKSTQTRLREHMDNSVCGLPSSPSLAQQRIASSPTQLLSSRSAEDSLQALLAATRTELSRQFQDELSAERSARMKAMAEVWGHTEHLIEDALSAAIPRVTAPSVPRQEAGGGGEAQLAKKVTDLHLEVRTIAGELRRLVEGLAAALRTTAAHADVQHIQVALGKFAAAADVQHLEAEVRRLGAELRPLSSSLAACEQEAAALHSFVHEDYEALRARSNRNYAVSSQVTQTDGSPAPPPGTRHVAEWQAKALSAELERRDPPSTPVRATTGSAVCPPSEAGSPQIVPQSSFQNDRASVGGGPRAAYSVQVHHRQTSGSASLAAPRAPG